MKDNQFKRDILITITATIGAILLFGIIAGLFLISDDEFARKGGVQLVLSVATDDVLNLELDQDALAISREFKEKDISFESSGRRDGYCINVQGVIASGESKARDFLEEMYDGNYEIRSRVSEGKTGFTLTLRKSRIRSIRESTIRQTMQTIRRRMDAFGVTAANLQQYGGNGEAVQDQIIVEFPGVDDPGRVKEIIRDTAQLELRLVKKTDGGPFPSIDAAYEANVGAFDEYEILRISRDDMGGGPVEYLVLRKDPVITGKDLKKVHPITDRNGSPAVSFFLKAKGAEQLEHVTREHIGDYMAIVLDDEVHSYPRINDTIRAEGIITGSFTRQEANDLALLLSTGALPAPVKILQENYVPPADD